VSAKRNVYKAVVLSIQLYDAEMWTIKAPDLRRLTTFHNYYVWTILGVSRYQQWRKHKQLLFGELRRKQPFHGTKKTVA